MKFKSIIVASVLVLFCLASNAQLKLYSSGSMSIGSTNDPGSGKVSFDHEAIFNNGSNLFNKYNSGGGLTVKGSAGTFSMYGDNDHYILTTSKDYFRFEDEVRFTDGIKVNASGSSEFWSTSTFKSAVNFGEYGTVNNTTFYGNVLIENANASATFTSNRAGSFNNGLTVSNYLTIYGTFNNYSDINLKTKIQDINKGALDKIIRLQGVTYSFKIDKESEPPRAGFIAQEVQKIFPDLVVEEKEGLAINSLEFIPYLVEAIKEQQELIKDLQSQISDLTGAKAKAAYSNDPNIENLSSNELFQNVPNPYTEETTIKYALAEGTTSATLLVCDMSGRLIQKYDLNTNGAGDVVISGGELDPGQYMYTLLADGQLIGTKQMVLTR